jgi:DNA repair protein RadD
MLTPRPYQTAAVEAAIDYLINDTGNQCIQVPTAGGKSLIQAEIAKRAHDLAPDYKMLFMTDVTALIGQNEAELKAQWPSAKTSIYSASYDSKNASGDCIFAGIQSVCTIRFTKAFLSIARMCA